MNIPGHDHAELLEKANWFHLKHSEEEKMNYTTVSFSLLICHLLKKNIKNRFDASKPRLYRGYFPIIKNQGSHKECFEIGNCEGTFESHQSKYDASSVASLMLEPAQWPQFEKEMSESEEFRKTIRAEYEVYHMVARVLIECIAKGLKIDVQEFRKRTNKTVATFRLIF